MADLSKRVVRLDIQAMRAVAVAMVVAYHLAPRFLPGGFVGVDAFFVVSGFLITGLLTERPHTGPAGLIDFWARRIRRLLPAALLVLAVTLVAGRLLLSSTRWPSTAAQAGAAALYLVNWALIRDAVDYLAAENAPTAIQHFWSLAVEEQFYIGWPILLLVLGLFAPSARRRTSAYGIGLSVVVVASFAYSIHLTATNPAVAYFSTWTRIWELGAGGMLAVAAPLLARHLGSRPKLGSALATVGWVALAITGVIYSDDTPFPGWQAALPVVGALLVIAGRSDFRWYAIRAVHWLGDVSYSVYLWHWPLVIFVPLAIAHGGGSADRGPLDNILIVAATLVLAGLTKTFVEDRFRKPHPATRQRRVYALAVAGMAIVVAAAATLSFQADRLRQQDQRKLDLVLADNNPCVGAGALSPALDCPPHRGALVLTPALAAEDRSPSFARANGRAVCMAEASSFLVLPCRYGDPKGTFDVALFGNSHAAHWTPALDAIGKTRHWRVTTYLAASCGGYYALPDYPTRAMAERCEAWAHDVVSALQREKPDLIIFTSHIGRTAWGKRTIRASYPVFEEGFRKMLIDLASHDRQVVVLRDTPVPASDGVDAVPDCVERNHRNLLRCAGPRTEWITIDPASRAAKRVNRPNITVADLNDYFCSRTTCFSVIGGVVVYEDGHHVSATYSRTLAPYLSAALDRALVP